ncbi:hypothetical protein [Burkholderia latens]|uniref:hypothetical protein n=1 Tax=Burkholderia latens TaxID=488446 RepID=UPI001589F933|nr:hypothetical protein [Burkholderia latens]
MHLVKIVGSCSVPAPTACEAKIASAIGIPVTGRKIFVRFAKDAWTGYEGRGLRLPLTVRKRVYMQPLGHEGTPDFGITRGADPIDRAERQFVEQRKDPAVWR